MVPADELLSQFIEPALVGRSHSESPLDGQQMAGAGKSPAPAGWLVIVPPPPYGTSIARVISVCRWLHSAAANASFTSASGKVCDTSL